MWRGMKESTSLDVDIWRKVGIQILERRARIMWLEFSLWVKQELPVSFVLPSLTIPPIQRSWRLLLTPFADGAYNMALDEALMEHARRANEWVLRVYGWSTPTLSFGR